jgi:hypothetical protein
MADLAELIRIVHQAFEDEQEWRDNVANPCQDYYDGNPETHRQGSADQEIRKVQQVNENEIGPQIDGVVGENEFIGYNWRVRAFKNSDEPMSVVLDELLQHSRQDGEMEGEFNRVFKDGVILGRGAIELVVENDRDGAVKITGEYIPWNEFFMDRACQRMDLKRCRYAGRLKWVNYDVAKALWGINPEELPTDTSMTVTPTEAEKDSDRVVWNDTKNKRIHVCEMWCIHEGKVYRYTFTDGKMLKEETDPLSNPSRPDGVPVFNKIPIVVYLIKFDKNGNPYGLVSNMIHSQDMIDMHSSKARYELLSLRLLAETDAFDMTEAEIAEQMADPACFLKLRPGALQNNKIRIDEGLDKAQIHSQLSAQHSARLQLVSGISTAFQGIREGYEATSSREAREERSRRVLGNVFGNARRAQIIFGKMWLELAAQWMTEDQFVRITENGLRRLREIGATTMMQQIEQNGGGMAFNAAMISAMKYDVTIDKIASNPNVQHEQFKGLIELRKAGSPIPDELIVESSDLPQKEKLIAGIQQMRQMASQPPMDVQAKAQRDMADAQLKTMQAQMLSMEANIRAGEAQAKTIEAQSKAQLVSMEAQLTKIQAQVEMEHKAIDARRLDALAKKTEAETDESRAKATNLLADAHKKTAEAENIHAQRGPNAMKTVAEAHKANTDAEVSRRQPVSPRREA